MISDGLQDYLTRWLIWAEGENPTCDYAFDPRFGLCQLVPLSQTGELSKLFRACGLLPGHPFGINNYYIRKAQGTQHLDPARLAFVRWALGLKEDFRP